MSHVTVEATAREKQLAHACDLTVIADSAAFIHEPRLIEQLAIDRLGLQRAPQAVRFDLLAMPDLAQMSGNQAALDLIASDLLTAIGLHGAEQVMVLTRDQGHEALVERLSSHPSIRGRLKRIDGQTVKSPAFSPRPELMVVGCMDWRLHAIGDFAAKARYSLGRGRDQALVATIPGVAKDLTSETVRFQTLVGWLKRLQASGLKRLHLVSHDDCGKYGGHQAFSDYEQEIACLTADLKVAAARLEEIMPQLEVSIGLAKLTDNRTSEVKVL